MTSGPEESLRDAWLQLKESFEHDLSRYDIVIDIAEQTISHLQQMRDDGLITEEGEEAEILRHRAIIDTARETQSTIAGWIEEGDVMYL